MIFLAVALALGIGACGDDANGPDGTGKSMTAKVNGKSVSINSVFWGVRTSDFYASGSPEIGIAQETVDISGKNINNNSTGTFDIGGTGPVQLIGQYTAAGSGGTVYRTVRADKRVAGTMTITAIDTTQLKGTFSFTAWNTSNPNDSVVVTEGTVNLKKDY
jgi:hypothetical protein